MKKELYKLLVETLKALRRQFYKHVFNIKVK